MRYDQRTGKMFANGNVVLIEPNGDAIFGDEVEVTGDLREGFAQVVGMLRKDNSRIAAAQATRREGNVLVLDHAVYSPCPLCSSGKGGPLWQINARRVVLDDQAETVTYRDAWMEMFGVPVAYTPWLRTPAPGVKRQSGFLTPTFGSSSELGLLVQVPYHYVLDQSSDFTVAPIFTQNGGTVLNGEYRRLHSNGYSQLNGAFTYAARDESDRDSEELKEFRGYIHGFGGYGVTDHSNAGYDVFLSSDNTFLDRYQFDDSDVLRSRVYLEGQENRNFWTLNGYYFQGLGPTYDQDTIPIALPLAETRLVSDRMRWGSYFTADSNVLALTRTKGLDTRRLSNRVGWTLPSVGPIGDVRRIELSLRGDVYDTEGDPRTFSSTGGNNTEARVLPRFTADWSWPLADITGKWVTRSSPRSASTSRRAGATRATFPTRTARTSSSTRPTCSSPSAFRASIGSTPAAGSPTGCASARWARARRNSAAASAKASRSPRIRSIPPKSGVQDHLSDYVGAFYVRPNALLDLSYRFRLGKDDLKFRRSDALASFGPAFLRFNLGYINLSQEPQAFDDDDNSSSNPTGFESREEITAGVRVKLSDSVAIGGQTRRDLSAKRTIANQAGLIYTHPCLILAVGIEQRLTPDAPLGDQTAVLFRVAFRNLADFEAGGSLFGSTGGSG